MKNKRRQQVIGLLLIEFFFLQGSVCAQEEKIPEPLELVKQVLNQRKKITIGYIQLEQHYIKSSHSKNYERLIVDYSFWFKPDKIKVKHCNNVKDQKNDNPPCATNVWSSQARTMVPMDDKYAVKYLMEELPFSSMHEPPPWMIGIAPMDLGFFKNYSFDVTLLLPDDAEQIEITPDKIGGYKTWKLSYQRRRSDYYQETQTWIAPDLDYLVLKSESLEKYSFMTQKWRYENKPKKYGCHWFPEEIITICEKEGKVTDEEKIKIIRAEFNQNVSDDEFELKSLGLPMGREVIQDSTLKYWDGEKLVGTFVGPGLPSQEINHNKMRRWVFIMTINALACAYIAARIYLKNEKNKR
ncbi:MAG: hypothetical protein LBT05_03820 [Planctomycetaceae bacterium]|nr:hypothetical protein [Planctomycetaceae bacterium]